MSLPLYSLLASAVKQYRSDNPIFEEKGEETIRQIMDSFAPSGSGFDSGISLDLERSKVDRLVFSADFHHMDDNGYYCGWSHHTVVVTPTLLWDTPVLRVTGRDKRQIKEYIGDVFHEFLNEKLCYDTEKKEYYSPSRNAKRAYYEERMTRNG